MTISLATAGGCYLFGTWTWKFRRRSYREITAKSMVPIAVFRSLVY
jgi:hypothetical protein